jgi:hypothetical protein
VLKICKLTDQQRRGIDRCYNRRSLMCKKDKLDPIGVCNVNFDRDNNTTTTTTTRRTATPAILFSHGTGWHFGTQMPLESRLTLQVLSSIEHGYRDRSEHTFDRWCKARVSAAQAYAICDNTNEKHTKLSKIENGARGERRRRAKTNVGGRGVGGTGVGGMGVGGMGVGGRGVG